MKKLNQWYYERKIKYIGKHLDSLNKFLHRTKEMKKYGCLFHNHILIDDLAKASNTFNEMGIEHASAILNLKKTNNSVMLIQAIGRSMIPTIEPSDILLIGRCAVHEVKERDIILGNSAIHRVVALKKVENYSFAVTKGDNNEKEDEPEMPLEYCLEGKVVKIVKPRDKEYKYLHELMNLRR